MYSNIVYNKNVHITFYENELTAYMSCYIYVTCQLLGQWSP